MVGVIRPEALLDAARTYLVEPVVSEPVFLELRAIAAGLCACALSVGCEVRLSGSGPVDLGVSVSPTGSGAQVLAGRIDDGVLSSAAAQDDHWRRLRDFAHGWTKPDSPLQVRVPFLFLELDFDGPRLPVPIPSVFLGVDWPIAELSAEGRALACVGFDLVVDAAQGLRSELFDRAILDMSRECFAALPIGGVLLHVGVMLARPGESLRLSVIVPRVEVANYLVRIGRTIGVDTLSAAIERYAPIGGFPHPGSHVQLDFDPGGVDARMGVTLCPPRQELWPLLLAVLCEDRLCDPEKAEALLRWPGVSEERLAPDLPPCLLRRKIEHVKLAFAPDGLLGAKAYFGVTLQWAHE